MGHDVTRASRVGCECECQERYMVTQKSSHLLLTPLDQLTEGASD